MQIVGEAVDGLEAVQKAQELKPDLVLLDIGLPKLEWDRSSEADRGSGPRHEDTLFNSEQRYGCGTGSFQQRSTRIRAENGRRT